jgi:hypothetical protein
MEGLEIPAIDAPAHQGRSPLEGGEDRSGVFATSPRRSQLKGVCPGHVLDESRPVGDLLDQSLGPPRRDGEVLAEGEVVLQQGGPSIFGLPPP